MEGLDREQNPTAWGERVSEWRGEDGVSSKVEIEGTRTLGVRLQPCRYVAPVLCIYDMKL